MAIISAPSSSASPSRWRDRLREGYRRKTRASQPPKAPADEYVLGYCYQPDVAYLVEMPASEWRAHLPQTAYWPAQLKEFRLRGLLLGGLSGFAVIWIGLLAPLGILLASVAAAVFGIAPGMLVGWAQGHRLATPAFYTFRRLPLDDDLPDSQAAGPQWQVVPITHTNLGLEVTGGERPPGVFLAATWSRKAKAAAIVRFFSSRWNKGEVFAIGSLIVMVICMMVVVLFFVMATQGG